MFLHFIFILQYYYNPIIFPYTGVICFFFLSYFLEQTLVDGTRFFKVFSSSKNEYNKPT